MKPPQKKPKSKVDPQAEAELLREHLSWHRLVLAIMAFVAGAAVMIIELAAIRILAPWFGNSLYTWTGLIGVILIAMSLGYYFGGWLADKKTSYTYLAFILTAAALFTLAIPLVSNLIGLWVVSYNVLWGPVFASLLLFALPGCLLGAVSPYIIRLISLLMADKHIGLSAGTVFMVSTIGSVLGTFAAGFWLIPTLNLDNIFWSTGLVIACLAFLGYFLSFQQRGKSFLALLILLGISGSLVLAASLTKPPPVADLLYEKTSFYHRLRVIKENDPHDPARKRMISLYLDTTREGSHYENSPEIAIRAQRYWELAPLLSGRLNSALILGGGAFKLPQVVLDSYPEARVEVVEIDPAVVEVGRRFFRLADYPKLHIAVDDARRYLTHTTIKYDLIFGDAYSGKASIPYHLLTREFFSAVKGRLNERGVFILNLISATQGKNSPLFLSVMNTIHQVFKNTYVFAVDPKNLTHRQNLIIVAMDYDVNLDAIIANIPKEKMPLLALLQGYVSPQTYDFRNSSIMTDRFNPVEYYVAQTLRK